MINTRERHPDSEVVHFAVGELDVASAPDLREALRGELAHGTGPVVLDCSRLMFIDAAGLGVLVWAANQAQSLRRPFELRNRHAAMDDLLRLTGLDRRFPALGSRSADPLGTLIA